MATLVKIDKNGTKYFSGTEVCGKCHGSGIIPHYFHVDNGVCFDCHGSGVIEVNYKEYTPEYAAKLESRRAAKRAKKEAAEAEANKAKEEARRLREEEYAKAKAEREAKWAEERAKSNFVGELGDKVSMVLTYNRTASWAQRSYTKWHSYDNVYLHIFKDDLGNTFTWKTSHPLFLEVEEPVQVMDINGNSHDTGDFHIINKQVEVGSKIHIKGTLKDHREYNGEKQNVLTRCKIEKI